MRTTKDGRQTVIDKYREIGAVLPAYIADLADAVEWLVDITGVQCPVCGGEDGDHAETCELGAFLREPEGEEEPEEAMTTPNETRPPEGYETWLDYALFLANGYDGARPACRARAELAALRARLVEAEAMNAEFIDAGAKLGIRLAKLEAKPEPPGTPRPVKTVTCPHCSHSQEPPEHEVYYDEDEYPDILCQSCGAYFDAVVEVAISWRTMKKERFNE